MEQNGHLPPAVWVEAAGAVQADDDADVRLEARGLAVAEMADVTFAERIAALPIGAGVAVARGESAWTTGSVVVRARDYLIVRSNRDVLIPTHTVVAISSLPRVLHEESLAALSGPISGSWQSILRDLMGESIQIATRGFEHRGHVTWVGADHVTVRLPGNGSVATDITIPWAQIDSITLPADWAVR
jgi:hypothetical protein